MSANEGLSLDALIERLQAIREKSGGDVKVAVTFAPCNDGEEKLLTAEEVQLLPATGSSCYDIPGPDYVGIGPIYRS